MPTVRKSLAWSFAERYLGLIISVASTMILARLLTPREIGVFSLCAAFLAVAGILRDFGVSEFLIQEKDLTKGKVQGAFAVALITAYVLGVSLLALRGMVANYYAEPGVYNAMTVLSLNFFLLPLASPAFALLNRELAFHKIFVAQTASNLVQASTAVLLAFQAHGYMSLAWASVAGTASQVIVVTLLRPKETFIWPSLREARIVWSYGLMFASARTIETINRNAHEFFIAKQLGFESLGIFSRALGLVELFYTSVTSAVLRVATPSFASDHRAGVALNKGFARSSSILTSIAWPFFAFVAISARDIIVVLFGHQWESASTIASILCISSGLSAMGAFGPTLLSATGNVSRRLRITMIMSPIQLIGIAVASFFGLEAIAMVWVGMNMIGFYFYGIETYRIAKFTRLDLLRACGKSAFLTVVTAGSQILVVIAAEYMNVPDLLKLGLVVIAIGLAWFPAVFLLRHPTAEEIRRFWLAYWTRGRSSPSS